MNTTIPRNDVMLLRFQAIAEETRLRIVQLLTGGERCVCELQDDLQAAQSRLSFHLKKLKDAGVVTDRRDGRWVYYSLVPEALEDMRGFLSDVHAGDDTVWLRPVSITPSTSRKTAPTGTPCCG